MGMGTPEPGWAVDPDGRRLARCRTAGWGVTRALAGNADADNDATGATHESDLWGRCGCAHVVSPNNRGVGWQDRVTGNQVTAMLPSLVAPRIAFRCLYLALARPSPIQVGLAHDRRHGCIVVAMAVMYR